MQRYGKLLVFVIVFRLTICGTLRVDYFISYLKLYFIKLQMPRPSLPSFFTLSLSLSASAENEVGKVVYRVDRRSVFSAH